MKKTKLFGIGLASILSVASVGCSNKQSDENDKKPTMEEKAQNLRKHNGREDISLSYIQPQKDFIKSVNCLLSLYKDVIPLVEKNAPELGIGLALHQAFSQCRMEGKLKENSKAYNFDDIICMNYAGNTLKEWKIAFEKAGKEAQKILAEGDAVSRKYVPETTTGNPFLRREIVNTSEITWYTADEYETQRRILDQTRDYLAREKGGI